MRVQQYPHYLWVIEGESELNDRRFVCRCREETTGRTPDLTLQIVLFVKISSQIQIPKGSERIEEGTTIAVTQDEAGLKTRVIGEVIKYDEGQLHNRLWI